MKTKIIIIPVHNQLPFLIKCLESLFSKTHNNFKIIIVNDGSNDETSEWLDKYSNCIILKNDIPLGFSMACNKGIDFAILNFDFNCLCLLNSDTEIVTDNWFDKIEENILKDHIGVAGPVSNNASYQTIYNIEKYVHNIDNKMVQYTKLVHGFCYFISKDLIMTIGRLDDDLFPHYGSEDDYSLKSIKNGFKNIIVPSVLVKHQSEASYGEKRKLLTKKSSMDLRKRWEEKYIKDCINELILIQKNINTNV